MVLWKVWDVFLRPKGRRRNSKSPKEVMMAVFGMLAWRSSLEKNLELEILAEKLETSGRGYLSGIVAVLRLPKSPQCLQVPSG